MKILITGATGFIGQYLVSLLRAEHELLLVSRQPELAAKQLAVDNSKVIQLKQLNSLDGVDAIINLAGESLAAKRWSVEQKRRISESRWLMTETLLEKLKNSTPAPRVWINASAIGFYGAQGAEPCRQAATDQHDPALSKCRDTRQSERLLHDARVSAVMEPSPCADWQAF